jgi:hypothetical protein
MALFWGAIGVFKNPSSHRHVEYEDPTAASEVVLLADLLLRLLDGLTERLMRSWGPSGLIIGSRQWTSILLTERFGDGLGRRSGRGDRRN